MFSAKAANQQANASFVDLVVNGVIDLQSLHHQVRSCSIRSKHKSDQNNDNDDIPYDLARLATVSIDAGDGRLLAVENSDDD